MKLLFVTAEVPFPPLNGFALNLVKHMEHLARRHEVSLAVITSSGAADVAIHGELVPGWVKRLYRITGVRSSIMTACLDELLLRRPTYYAWNFSSEELERKIGSENFDAVIATPVGLGSFCDAYRMVFPDKAVKTVLMIHDSASRLYADEAFRFLQGTSKRSFISAARLIRLPLIRAHERRYLRRYDGVQVQKVGEADYLRGLLGLHSPEMIVARTGVNESLLEIEYQSSSRQVLFMTHLQAGRERQALWFIESVWPDIYRHFKQSISLVLVGAPATGHIKEKLSRVEGVVQRGFVEELTQVFANKIVSLVPVYQTSGVVTKVIDSLAAGVPVIGFTSALLTVEGLIPGVHAVGVERKNDLAASVIRTLEAPEMLEEMSVRARKFISSRFSWEEELRRFESALSRLTS